MNFKKSINLIAFQIIKELKFHSI